MNHIRKKDHIYDVVIVGAGLAGLVVAASLLKKGLNICLLEGGDFPGGHSRSVYSPIGLVDNGIKFFPDKESTHVAIKGLNSVLTHSIEFNSIENGPVTYHNGDIKPFVGFGKDAPEFHRELSYFLDPKRLELSRTLGQIVSDLSAQIGDVFYPGSTVTKYFGHEGRISSVMVNGQKQIYGREFVHACSPKFLAVLLPDEVLSARAKQKIAKANYWTILGLDIFHRGTVSESTELHLLNGTTQDDLGPCVGMFYPAVTTENSEGVLQHSQWMTFVENDDSEDPEIIGAILKKIKRQIKRAYPEALDKMFSERILVAPLVEADLDLKFDKQGAFSGISNLWLAHGSAIDEFNIVGSILQSLNVTNQILAIETRAEIETPHSIN